MARVSPAGSAPGSPRLNGPSWVASPAGHRPGSAADPTRLPLDRAFPRSAWCAVKIARTLVALAAFICFLTAGEQVFYTVYAGLQTVTTVFFLLLYLLRLDVRMRCRYWLQALLAVSASRAVNRRHLLSQGTLSASPVIVSVQDILNSVTSVMFLTPVGLTAVKITTNKGIMAGGVLSLILLALYHVDMFLLWKKISQLEKARGRSAAK